MTALVAIALQEIVDFNLQMPGNADGYRQNTGVLSASELQPTDPNLRQCAWQYANSQRTFYPTFRVDYNISDRWRLNLVFSQSKGRASQQATSRRIEFRGNRNSDAAA